MFFHSPGLRNPRGLSEAGFSLIEALVVGLIITILLVSLTSALRSLVGSNIAAKEKARAQVLARDKLEQVKRMGYQNLAPRVTRYFHPLDPKHPSWSANPAPSPGDEAWTPEVIMSGSTASTAIPYWRHVKVKCVEDLSSGIVQRPLPDPADTGTVVAGGTDTSSNLMHIEVVVTWQSRLTGNQRMVRVSSMVANMDVTGSNIGRIEGTLWDDGIDFASIADDVRITLTVSGAPLSVFATNVVTGDEFSATTDQWGDYRIGGLPYGRYIVSLEGWPRYYGGKYNASTNPISPPNPIPSDPVEIQVTAGALTQTGIDIWTARLHTVAVRGFFIGVDEGSTVYVSADDGLSEPQTIVAPKDCTTGDECVFEVENVPWPVEAQRRVVLTLTAVHAGSSTALTFTTATLCMDSAALGIDPALGGATDYYWGLSSPDFPTTFPMKPVAGPPPVPDCADCEPTAVPPGPGPGPQPATLECQTPPRVDVLDLSTFTFVPSSVKVAVNEYFNGTTTPMEARVFINDGSSVTVFTSSSGTILVESVDSTADPPIVVTVSATSYGYSVEQMTIGNVDHPLAPGQMLDLTPEPFVLKRVALVSGTVWRVCGGGGSPPCDPATSEGLANVSVAITNQNTNFTAVVVTDAGGRFVHDAVIQELSAYRVTPSAGADYTVEPTDLSFVVEQSGVHYWENASGDAFEFAVTVINGTLYGRIVHTADPTRPYHKGAIVIATTDTGALPAVLPDSTLSQAYTYATITGTDGTFNLRVATGVGDYTIHVLSPANAGTAVTSGPHTVAADSEVDAGDIPVP